MSHFSDGDFASYCKKDQRHRQIRRLPATPAALDASDVTIPNYPMSEFHPIQDRLRNEKPHDFEYNGGLQTKVSRTSDVRLTFIGNEN